MPQNDPCLCIDSLGGDVCENVVGIAELYWQSPKQISGITYIPAPSGLDCCKEGEIATITMDKSVTPVKGELFEPLDFVNQDDNSGAVFTGDTNSADGNKLRNRELTIQVNANTSAAKCILDKMVTREIAFIAKTKGGQYILINGDGGMRVTSVSFSTSQSYDIITMSGIPNKMELYIDPTWAKDNIVPVTQNPDGIVWAD